MIIEKIMKELTPERVKKEIAAIQAIELPPELQKWVKEYEKVGDRDEFFWKIVYKTVVMITFPIVKDNYLESLVTTKFLALMVVTVLLNDAVDKLKNKNLVDALSTIILKKNLSRSAIKKPIKKYVFLVKRLWKNVFSQIKKYPRFAEFEEIFNFDISQIINGNYYDYLQGKYYQITNETEAWMYPPHTMAAIMCCDIDLMCCPRFDIKEMGKIREIFLQIQKMARIGNWISSWKKELHEDDFTSGIFALAINSEIIKIGDFNNKTKVIKKLTKMKIEKKLIKEWMESYSRIQKIGENIKSVDAQSFLPGLKNLFMLELCLKN